MPTALFLSPHLDDVAFSCGGTLLRLTDDPRWRVTVCTIFTASVPDPQGFALRCQTDKGIPPEADYMALRRAEDDAYTTCAHVHDTRHWNYREAPHRGYESPAELFAGIRDGDDLQQTLADDLAALDDELRPDLVFAPQGLGNHVDHLQTIRATLATWPIERVVWYRDTPYAIREPDARPAGLLRLEEDLFPRRVQLSSAVLERKIAGCSLYASQIGFQFGGAIALGEKLTAFHGREAGADSSVAAAYAETFLGHPCVTPILPMNTSLAQAIDAYRAALPPAQLLEFSLTPLDRLGIPVQALTLLPSNEGSGSGLSWPLCEGIGYGETPEAARVGAYGELTEEVSSSAALTRLPRRIGSYHEMRARHGARGVVDPVTLCLEAGSAYTPDTVLEWMECRRWSTDESILIPAEFVACAGMDVPQRPGVSRLVTPITNGHGAGTTLAMAQSHGLLELLQRDGNSVHYRALAGTTAIDLGTITDPAARALLDRYYAAGVEIIVKVAATDFGFVNLYVVGYDRSEEGGGLPVMAAACGEAVHPVPEVALRKALLEFASSRARMALFHGSLDFVHRVTPPGYLEAYRQIVDPADEEPRGLAGMQHWVTLGWAEMREVLAPVFAVDERISFNDLPRPESPAFALDPATLLRLTVARLEEAGFEVLYVDLSPLGTSVHAVKMIVPGLEVETMSYQRIGERNIRRLLAREAADTSFPTLAGLGDAPMGTLPIPLTASARQRLGGGAWLDHREIAAAMENLYVLYREPSRHVTAFSRSDRQ